MPIGIHALAGAFRYGLGESAWCALLAFHGWWCHLLSPWTSLRHQFRSASETKRIRSASGGTRSESNSWMQVCQEEFARLPQERAGHGGEGSIDFLGFPAGCARSQTGKSFDSFWGDLAWPHCLSGKGSLSCIPEVVTESGRGQENCVQYRCASQVK